MGKIGEHPLAEVFGFQTGNFSREATRHRKNKLCPFNNKVPSCTKDKANDPLGVCSIFDKHQGGIAITCPIRFREKWLIAEDAAIFFFGSKARWTSLAEIRLNDKDGISAGNIDLVLVTYNEDGVITDFGALEVQAVYISGNMRRPFEVYMKSPKKNQNMNWTNEEFYPRADYLSSSRKRLLPQLLYKGNILKDWGKKTAVAIHRNFFNTLPILPEVRKNKADIAWLVYDLKEIKTKKRFVLVRDKVIYTPFSAALEKITMSRAGNVEDFLQVLQVKLNDQLRNLAPTNLLITDIPKEE